MQNQNAIRRVKIAVLLLIAACACSLYLSRQTSASKAEPQSQRRYELVGIDAPASERAGTDDGAAFVVHFFGNTHGSLAPCG